MQISDGLHLRLRFGKMVDIDYEILDKVALFIKSLKKPEEFKPEEWRDSAFWPDDHEGQSTISQFFTLGNSINFRYWRISENNTFEYCQGLKGGSNQRGAFYMWKSLRLAQTKGTPILDAKTLSKISMDEMKKIFRDDQNRDVMPVLKERQKNWRDLGTKLLEYWDGQFYNLVKASKGSLLDFVRYSREFRAFDDPLGKMTMVNAILHRGRGLAKFCEPILPGIDYQLLKQQMRLGILVLLNRKMEKKIIAQKLLTATEARELRNAGLSSFLYLMEKTSVSGDVLDNIWWTNRKTCDDQKPKCGQCLFKEVCKKKTAYGIPLELTRYY